MSRPVVLWRFSDGRAGHDSQSLGLARALAARRPLSLHTLGPDCCRRAWRYWMRGRFPPGEALPAPDILLGAGHATHPALLAARRARGGRALVLMRPSLPLSWFDLCVIPAHDRPPARPNVLVTRGVLSRVGPGGRHDAARGLVLIGGPSRHHGWDADRLLDQLRALRAARPVRHWTLALSPRTPPGFDSALRALGMAPYRDAHDPDWLAAQLADAGEVWVTADSVSMLCEALASGARVGVLAMPVRRPGRVTRALDDLVAGGWLAPPGSLCLAEPVPAPLDEAARCAKWLEQRWLAA